MPVRAVRAGADFVEIDDGRRIIRVTEADVGRGTKAEMASAMQAPLQEGLTVRRKVVDLPADDPDRTTDPGGGERLKWEGDGVNRELVSRSVIVVSVTWDGTGYHPVFRRARV